jgi:hypothetical protein
MDHWWSWRASQRFLVSQMMYVIFLCVIPCKKRHIKESLLTGDRTNHNYDDQAFLEKRRFVGEKY